jgi:ATP-dependent Clp protease ATP-binding subunit ClpA
MFERYSDQTRRLIAMALWSAKRRGGSYIEPEDLLHALIRDDRGEFAAISAEIFPGAQGHYKHSDGSHRPFFSDRVAASLLRELREDPNPASAEPRAGKREPAPHVDMPVSDSLMEVLASVANARQGDTKTIEPLDLLAAIVEDRDSRLAQLLRDHDITRQRVASWLGSR